MRRNMFGAPRADEIFAGLDCQAATEEAMERIAIRIRDERRPGAVSDIPAGAVYLAQLAAHDLDFQSRLEPGESLAGQFDLGIIYGDGPRHDAFCYRQPQRPGEPRYLLRMGRARPTANSPAWGAPRDLPRIACPHLDDRGLEDPTDVLIPNAFSDSNTLLAQVQTLWMLLHNAVAEKLAAEGGTADAFRHARAITSGAFHDALRRDVLGTWLKPGELRDHYVEGAPPMEGVVAPGRASIEFMSGVGRIGHAMVREVYALNDARAMVGLRDVIRHTGTGRPTEMPLTEDWLLDFARFFRIGGSEPQRTRAIGPHIARAFGEVGTNGRSSYPADGLVLRDLIACARDRLRSVGSLIAELYGRGGAIAREHYAPGGELRGAVEAWLAGAGLAQDEIARLAENPPLTLYLMLEAEHETGGATLGTLGSLLMGETFAAAMPAAVAEEAAAAQAAVQVFDDRPPAGMAEVIGFLQDHYRFAEGARLYPRGPRASAPSAKLQQTWGHEEMLDTDSKTAKRVPQSRVIDYLEMGRLVVQWTQDPSSRPKPGDMAELRRQLDGIAVIPPEVTDFFFCENSVEKLAIRLPARAMVDQAVEELSDPTSGYGYRIPQFYADHFRPGLGPVLSPLDMLFAKIGDYTIAQCQ